MTTTKENTTMDTTYIADVLAELDDILQDQPHGMELLRTVANHIGVTIEDVPTRTIGLTYA